jgi:CRISPR/Cas system CSM-associated protein Csm3 (group 7 of RAMP superfamily)
LLEKFGGNVPNDETGEISIFDAYKIKAARAVIQHNRQKEGIGGYVSRGYGKIEFTFTEFCARSLDFFRGSIDKITGKTSGEFSIAEARKEVENIINFLKEEF